MVVTAMVATEPPDRLAAWFQLRPDDLVAR